MPKHKESKTLTHALEAKEAKTQNRRFWEKGHRNKARRNKGMANHEAPRDTWPQESKSTETQETENKAPRNVRDWKT